MNRPAACAIAVLSLWGVAGFGASARLAPQGSVTFARDVAPIIYRRCASCHRPDGDAPFSLLTFEEVRARAQLIARVTRQRSMPPWKASGGGPFVGDRSLNAEEIETMARWATSGSARGSEADMPVVPTWRDGWQLGTPDLVVTLQEAYPLSADGPDEFRNFAVPLPIAALRYVEAIEMNVHGTRGIHHANLRIDPTDWSRQRDAEDPRPGYEGAVSPNARYPDGHVLGWTPGQTPTRAAKGMAWRLRPGADLVVQLHLRSTGQPEAVRPSVAFYFTVDAPDRAPLAIRLGRQNLDIAPDSTYVARDSYTLPVDVEVHAVHPHAHARATSVNAVARLPDGSERTLIHIADWDFNWQDVYRYREPLILPRGTTVTTQFTYDNSARNPRNPDTPARHVRFGQNASDEMGDLWLQVVTKTAADRTLLYNDIYPKTVAEDVAGYEMVLRGNPTHAGYRRDLANGYYNLGTLYLTRYRYEEAVSVFRSALQVRPNHSATHNNLGVALKGLKRLEEAITHFERAIQLDANNGSARQNLAAARALKQ